MRRNRSWTLAQLSARSGVAIATLSKVENARTGTFFDTMARVARALDLRLDDLLGASEGGFATGRRVISQPGEGVRLGFNRYEYLVPCNAMTRKAMGPLIMTIRTREVLPPESWASHEGEEYIYVLSGDIELHTEFYELAYLPTGSSVYFDSVMRHAFVSVGEGDATILSVCLADSLARLFAGSGADLSAARFAPGGARDNGNKS